MADNPVSGFPDVFGKHGVALVEHTGPASYVQVSGSAGGDVLKTPSFGGSTQVGTRSYAYVDCAMDYSGVYVVYPIYSSLNTPNAGIRTQIQLKWVTASTGAEVAPGTNLSAKTVRLLVIGG